MSSFIDDALKGYRMLLVMALIIITLPITIPLYLITKPIATELESWNEPTEDDLISMVTHAKGLWCDRMTCWGDDFAKVTDGNYANRKFLVWGKVIVTNGSPPRLDQSIDHAFVAEVTYHHQYRDDQAKRIRHKYSTDPDFDGSRTRNPAHYTFDSYKIIPIDDSDPAWEAKLGLPAEHAAHKPGSPQEAEERDRQNDHEWRESQYK